MGKTIVHIGTPKTGTTYLQLALERNRARLAEAGWHIPATGSLMLEAAGPAGQSYGHTICHHGVAWSLQGDRPLPFGVAPVAFNDLASELLAELSTNENNIISSECFYWEVRDIELIKSFRSAIPRGAKIVIWLRNRWEFIDSMYAQAVYDHGFCQTLDQYIQDNIDYFDYGAALSQWASIFGNENISIRSYDMSLDPLIELLRILDINVEGWDLPNINVNASLPKAFVPILMECGLDRARLLHLGDTAKRYSGQFPKVRLLNIDQIAYLSNEYRAGDSFLQLLDVEISVIGSAVAYLQARHFTDVTVKEISRGLGQLFSGVM